MKHFSRRCLCFLLLPCFLLPHSLAAVADVSAIAAGNDISRFESIIADMAHAASTLRDATYIFHKQEYADGEQQPAERIAVKYRAPNDIYMKWLGPVHQGRELLFRPGWNDDRLRVSPGRWLPTVNLDPNGYLAMRGNRHSIYQLPFAAIVDNFVTSASLLHANPALQVHIIQLGEQIHYGEPGDCYHLQLPRVQEPRLYAAEVMLCVSRRTGLPLRIRSWNVENGELRQVEDYGYENVQMDVGLTDADFDPDNTAYDF